MKIKIILIATLLLACVSAQAQTEEPTETAEQVLADYYKAIGGKERFDAIKSFHLIGSSKLGENEPGAFQFIYVRPEQLKVRTMIDTFKIIQCVNENIGWQLVPPRGITVPTKMSEDERLKVLGQRALVLGPFYNYKEEGKTLEYDGKVKKDDKVFKKLVLRSGDKGPRTTVYLSDSTNLIAVIEGQTRTSGGQPITVVSYFSKYVEVDGFMFPFSYISQVNGKTYTRLELDNIFLNKEYKDSDFELPESDKSK